MFHSKKWSLIDVSFLIKWNGMKKKTLLKIFFIYIIVLTTLAGYLSMKIVINTCSMKLLKNVSVSVFY